MGLTRSWPSLTASNPVFKVSLILFAALALVLATGGQARADECQTAQDCFTAATWQRAVADDYNNKANWFREQSRQDFVQAKEWGDKATFAFHAGDGTAAAWYKGLADAYSRDAVKNAKAADDYAAKAKFTYAAAAGNQDRGNWLQGCNDVENCSQFIRPPGLTDAQWFTIVAQGNDGQMVADSPAEVSICPDGMYCAAMAGNGPCKSVDNPRKREERADPREAYPKITVFTIHLRTKWCYKNGQITKMYKQPEAHCDVTLLGVGRGWECDNPDGSIRSECNGGNPEHCAWTASFDIHRSVWTPLGDKTVQRLHWCATNQVSGSGAHKRTGRCHTIPW